MHSTVLENEKASTNPHMGDDLPRRIAADAYEIESRGLTRRFGRHCALDGVDIGVPRESFYLLVGPNGAGKSTAFSLVLGLLRAHAGEIRVRGDLAGPDGRVRANIGHVPESHALGYPTLRVGRLLELHSRYRPTWDRQYADALARALEVKLDARAGKLSKGEARRVQLLLALAHRPPVLLLDEPTDGLDRVARDLFQRLLIDHVAQTPTTVLVASHVAYELEGLATDVGVLRSGRLVAQLSRSDLRERFRSYEFTASDDWRPPADVHPGKRERIGAGHRWTVWGDQDSIISRLTASGAVVHTVSPLTLDDATLALLTWEGK
jgi:ABC-2 type transport system ATP-binding protein